MKARKTGRLGFLVAAILTLAMVSLPGNAVAKDRNNDRIADGKENAGFVAAFGAEAGRLKITLYAGGSIEGRVGERTKIRCKRTSTDKVGDKSRASGKESAGRDHVRGRHHPRRGCSVRNLAEGVVVHEADVKYKANGVFFKRLVIVKPTAAG